MYLSIHPSLCLCTYFSLPIFLFEKYIFCSQLTLHIIWWHSFYCDILNPFDFLTSAGNSSDNRLNAKTQQLQCRPKQANAAPCTGKVKLRSLNYFLFAVISRLLWLFNVEKRCHTLEAVILMGWGLSNTVKDTLTYSSGLCVVDFANNDVQWLKWPNKLRTIVMLNVREINLLW